MKNEIAEAKGEERRVEKSSREARDSLALSQAERAERTLPALIIYLSRLRLQHSPFHLHFSYSYPDPLFHCYLFQQIYSLHLP